jgi:hypothetical protein
MGADRKNYLRGDYFICAHLGCDDGSDRDVEEDNTGDDDDNNNHQGRYTT